MLNYAVGVSMTVDPGLAAVVSALALFGGGASYLQGRRDQRVGPGLMELITELMTAALAGWSMYFLGAWQRWPEPLVCLLVIASTHNGAAVIGVLASGLLQGIKKLMRF